MKWPLFVPLLASLILPGLLAFPYGANDEGIYNTVVRAGAILIFVFDLPNHLTIAVGTQGEVTHKISAF